MRHNETEKYDSTSTLFIGNHQRGLGLVFPTLNLLRQHPNTSVVGWEGFSFVPGIDLIPVPIAHNDLPLLSRALFRFTREAPQSANELKSRRSHVVDAIVGELSNLRNVLIFPGTRAKGESEWRAGVGAVIKKTLAKNLSLNISFLYADGRWNSYCTNPQPVTDIIPLSTLEQTSKVITEALREKYAASYDNRYGSLAGLDA